MSRNAEITFDWADGPRVFRLAWGEIAELQERTACGPQFLLSRLVDGTWKADDLYHIIRLGLIGGGLAPLDALKLVDRYVKERPLLESVTPAKAILLAALTGAGGEPAPGKDEPGKTAATPSPTDGSTSPGSMDRPQ
jgi:hypothetical protein